MDDPWTVGDGGIVDEQTGSVQIDFFDRAQQAYDDLQAISDRCRDVFEDQGLCAIYYELQREQDRALKEFLAATEKLGQSLKFVPNDKA